MHIIAKSYKSLIHIIANAQAARRVFELDGSLTSNVTEVYPSKVMGSISMDYKLRDINVVFPLDVAENDTFSIVLSDVMRVLSRIREDYEVITTIDVPKMEPKGLCLVEERGKDFVNLKSLKIECMGNFGDHLTSEVLFNNALLTIFYDHYDIIACTDGEIFDTLQELTNKSRALDNVAKVNNLDYNMRHVKPYIYALYDPLFNNRAGLSVPMHKSCLGVQPVDRSQEFNFSKMKCNYCQSLIHRVFLKVVTDTNQVRYKCISCNNKCGTAVLQYSKHVGECPSHMHPALYELACTHILDMDAYLNIEYYGRTESFKYFVTKNAILIFTNTLANLLMIPPYFLDGSREVFLNMNG